MWRWTPSPTALPQAAGRFLARCNRRFLDLFPNQRGMIAPACILRILSPPWSATAACWKRDDPFGYCNAASLWHHREPEGSLILSMPTAPGSASASGAPATAAGWALHRHHRHQSARKCACAKAIWPRIRCCCKPRSNSIRQGIAVFDAHGALLAWNHRFSDLVGFVAAGAGGGQAHQPARAHAVLPFVWRAGNGRHARAHAGGNTTRCPMAALRRPHRHPSERKRRRADLLRDSEAKMRLITDVLPALIACGQPAFLPLHQSGLLRLVWHPAQRNQRPTHARKCWARDLFDGRHYVERALEGRASVFELELPAPAQYRIRQGDVYSALRPRPRRRAGLFAPDPGLSPIIRPRPRAGAFQRTTEQAWLSAPLSSATPTAACKRPSTPPKKPSAAKPAFAAASHDLCNR